MPGHGVSFSCEMSRTRCTRETPDRPIGTNLFVRHLFECGTLRHPLRPRSGDHNIRFVPLRFRWSNILKAPTKMETRNPDIFLQPAATVKNCLFFLFGTA